MNLVPLLVVALFTQTESKVADDGKCNSYNSNFNIEEILGTWWLQAIVPVASMEDKCVLPCVTLTFSEVEYESLKILTNNSLNLEDDQTLTSKSKVTIRQRYQGDTIYDVWSATVGDTRGCFMQVLSMNTTNENVKMSRDPKERMQLHIIKTDSETRNHPQRILVQLLWGNHIGAIFFADSKVATEKNLEKAFDFVENLRGPQMKMRKCLPRTI